MYVWIFYFSQAFNIKMFIFVTTFVTRFLLLHFFIFISLLNIELVDFVYFYKILFIITMIRDIETIS